MTEDDPKNIRSYLDDCLSRRVIFFTGKGGVGKSTLAWATAVACQRKKLRVTVASWNPLEPFAKPLAVEESGIRWIPLETLAAFKEYALQIFRFETIYHVVFDNHVLKTFIRAAPGVGETVVAGKIWDLYQKREQDLLIVDLPASGHAVTFFQSPLGVQKLFAMGFVHKEAEKIVEMFRSRESRIDLVALPEELPLAEGLQLKQKLESLHSFHFGYLHMNQCTPDLPVPPPSALSEFPETIRDCAERHVKRRELEADACGVVPEFKLPSIEVPRYASMSLHDTVDKVAAYLERA